MENLAERRGSSLAATGSVGWNRLYTCCTMGLAIGSAKQSIKLHYTLRILAHLNFH
jgi:hypothetical protein